MPKKQKKQQEPGKEPVKRKRGRPLEWTEERIRALGADLEAWYQDESNLFFGEYLAENDLYPELTARLAARSAYFSQLLKRLKQKQEQRLIKLASRQKINPVFTMFLLKNHHNYADKQEVRSENVNVNQNLDLSEISKASDDELMRQIQEMSRN